MLKKFIHETSFYERFIDDNKCTQQSTVYAKQFAIGFAMR